MFIEGHDVKEDVKADVCVVGAGAAGIALALELQSASLEVALLESGGLQLELETQALGAARQIGLKTDPLQNSRSRLFGGTTLMWGGQCRPLDEIDMKKRDWVPHSGWPISRASLDAPYERAMQLCGVKARDFRVEKWSPNKLEDSRLENIMYLNSPGPIRFGASYKEALQKTERISVLLHSTVVELQMNNSDTISSARVKNLAGREFKVEAKLFVLACGAVQNARLLLASNRAQPRGLGNQNDLVGRFFMQHPEIGETRMIAVSPAAAEKLARGTERIEVGVATRVRPSAQRAHRLLNSQLWYVGEVQMNAPGLRAGLKTLARRLKAPSSLRIPAAQIVTDLVSPAEKRDRTWGSSVMEATLVERPEQAPNPQSRITLDEAKDALGVPLVVMDWRMTELDRRSLDASRTLIAQTLGAQRIGRLCRPQTKSPWSLERPLHGGYHHLGTARMAKEASEGVVDPDCRVHGLKNLYVAGSATFPTSGYVNPTLTIVALSVRLAAHIQRVLGEAS